MIRAALYAGASTCVFISKALLAKERRVFCDQAIVREIGKDECLQKESTSLHQQRMVIGRPPKKETILITGASGFLGQHIVQLLQEKAENVEKIILFDMKPYRNKLGHSSRIPMKEILGDVRHLSELREAFKGVSSVIHAAGAVEFGFNPELDKLREINIKGTANVVQASVESKVTKLVFASSVDVVIGYNQLIDVNESCPVPEKFLFKGYPESKYLAEVLVLKSNGRSIGGSGEARLRTLSLRPSVMYGEEDPFYVTSGLEEAKSNKGVLMVVGGRKALFQQSYAGNVAWAFLCALSSMSKDEDLGGKALFITDDTPPMNSFDFTEIFLKILGYRLSTWSVPYPLAYSILWLSESLCWFLSPLVECTFKNSLSSLVYINTTFTFNRRYAEDLLGYKPLFTFEESINRSSEFYKNIFRNKSE